jgi:hypothetical protein
MVKARHMGLIRLVADSRACQALASRFTSRYRECGLRGSVLDCASPLALLVGSPPSAKRQKTGALQNLAGALTVHPLSFFRMHWDQEPRACLTLTHNLTLSASIKSRDQEICSRVRRRGYSYHQVHGGRRDSRAWLQILRHLPNLHLMPNKSGVFLDGPRY